MYIYVCLYLYTCMCVNVCVYVRNITRKKLEIDQYV